ncbi:hypothetical protein FOZ60_013256 [Perkinsus olseni]|uniref:Uncharacterized protein n=1 Tax=Perkinsus olseni TaxID=32597 RepID=A0A7J6NCD8_PEROL|nr:hypothetical protein FOZ60_013256 [Perkinsus olseni]
MGCCGSDLAGEDDAGMLTRHDSDWSVPSVVHLELTMQPSKAYSVASPSPRGNASVRSIVSQVNARKWSEEMFEEKLANRRRDRAHFPLFLRCLMKLFPVVRIYPIGSSCDPSPVLKSLGLSSTPATLELDTKYYTCSVGVVCRSRELNEEPSEAVVVVVDRPGSVCLPESRFDESAVKLMVALDPMTAAAEEWCWDRGFEVVDFHEEPERVLEALKMHHWSNAKLKTAHEAGGAKQEGSVKKANEVSIEELDGLMGEIKAAHDLALRGGSDVERKQRAEQLAMRLMQCMESDSEDEDA